MPKKLFTLLITFAVLLSVTACSGKDGNASDKSKNREVILSNDNTNEERNKLLAEDIEYFKQELPKRHKNLFSNITKEEFNDRADQLINRLDQLNNVQVFTELNKIIALIGDAHTSINYWDGYSYPLQFWIFDGKVYIVNADKSLEKMIYSQVLKIDGVDINIIIEQLTSLIPHENESWVSAMLPGYLQAPVYLYGLGIVQNEKEAVFTVQKEGKDQDFTITALEFGQSPDYVKKQTRDNLIGKYDTNYSYKYLPDSKALYFEYNVCADLDNLKFSDFNKEMSDFIEKNDVNKIIVDLRNNSGGNSEILNPFTDHLKSYISENSNVKVYILVERNTFSSGMFAIYRVKEAAPEAVTVGEATGGAMDCFGEVRTFNLPNSQVPISYSTKYFEFSKDFSYKNPGVGTFLPDITIQPTIEDYMVGMDPVLEYALNTDKGDITSEEPPEAEVVVPSMEPESESEAEVTVPAADTENERVAQTLDKDIDGNGIMDSVQTIMKNDDTESFIRVYLNGEQILEYQDPNIKMMGALAFEYLDLDGDSNNEIFIAADTNANSRPLMDVLIFKETDGPWNQMAIPVNGNGNNGFSFKITRGKEEFDFIISSEDIDDVIHFDATSLFVNDESGNIDSIQAYRSNHYKEGDEVGFISAWGIWEAKTGTYEGRNCIIAVQGIEGPYGHGLGQINIYFAYNEQGEVEILNVEYQPE